MKSTCSIEMFVDRVRTTHVFVCVFQHARTNNTYLYALCSTFDASGVSQAVAVKTGAKINNFSKWSYQTHFLVKIAENLHISVRWRYVCMIILSTVPRIISHEYISVSRQPDYHISYFGCIMHSVL